MRSATPDTIRARANLATSYYQAGRTNDAIAILEKVVTESDAVLGAAHPDTIRAREVLDRWNAG